MASVRVSCSVPNGIELRTFKQGVLRDPESGERTMVPDGRRHLLPGPSAALMGVGATSGEPVITEVDEEFISAWLEQNARNPLVTGGSIALVKKDDPGEGP